MSQNLTAKQRAIAFQHWSSLIMREGRDLDSLERISGQALHDRDVQADAQLQTMVQAELERRRAELRREQQNEQQSQCSYKPPSKYRAATPRRDDPGWRRSPDFAPEFLYERIRVPA